jgi:hypothetical protein
LPERLTARRPVLLAARMLARNKFLYSFSRPACGRPPAAAVLGRQTGPKSGLVAAFRAPLPTRAIGKAVGPGNAGAHRCPPSGGSRFGVRGC